MPREGVSYDQVAALADALVAEGRDASTRAVRERLGGRGSPNTIHRHLVKWREARGPRVPAPPAELPSAIAREIQQEIARAVAAARAELEEQLVQAQTEARDLAEAGEALEADRETLQEQIAALSRERDTLSGRSSEQATELSRLSQEIERERRTAEEARIAVAQARLSGQQHERQLESLTLELKELRAALRDEQIARVAAQQKQAGLEASCTALTTRLEEAQGREQAVVRALEELRKRLDNEVEAVRQSTGELARRQAEVEALQNRLGRCEAELADARAELSKARDALHAAAVENARLQEQAKHDTDARKP